MVLDAKIMVRLRKWRQKLEEKKGEINILNKDFGLLHLTMAKTQRKKKGGICATLSSIIIVHLEMISDADLLCYYVIMISW